FNEASCPRPALEREKTTSAIIGFPRIRKDHIHAAMFKVDRISPMKSVPLDSRKSSSVFGQPSFSLSNRALRALWGVAWSLLASWTPPPLHPWRRFLLRLFGARIAPTARIYGSARIWYPPNLAMGAFSVLGWDVICYCQDRVTLKDFANVAQRAHLCAG